MKEDLKESLAKLKQGVREALDNFEDETGIRPDLEVVNIFQNVHEHTKCIRTEITLTH